jgi:plastocyanin
MIFKTLVLVGLVGSASAKLGEQKATVDDAELHLDLELEVNGERELFPLLPGTKCPTGHHCRVRSTSPNMSPMVNSLKNNIKTSLAATLDWNDLNSNLNTVVASNDYCSRRAAMARAAGLAAGVAATTVASPAYAAESKDVKMGSDSGQLVFVPAKISICKGDSVKWTNNKGGPHNVVFDEDEIPGGVDQEKISMDDQLGEEGDTFTMKFDVAGTYGYYCEPHRGAGMQATLIVA